MSQKSKGLVVIACGGTGGHLFPGVAVAGSLGELGFHSVLLTSEKEIDRLACQGATDLEVVSLAGAAWVAGSRWGSLKGICHSFKQAKKFFMERRPLILLAMGGFASVGPVLAARALKIPVVLHEANTVPGRATRWLAPFAGTILTGFEETTRLIAHEDVRHAGMPVRRSLGRPDAAESRTALGLDPVRPVLLVMGGSQGARAINDLWISAAPDVARLWPELQLIHLTGPGDFERIKSLNTTPALNTVLLPFATEMDCILAASTLAVSRSGASSLAEFAASSIPCILVPYPRAMDDHQRRNAETLERSGAASVLLQSEASPARLIQEILALREADHYARRQIGLRRWGGKDASKAVAGVLVNLVSGSDPGVSEESLPDAEVKMKLERGEIV